jgi:hypothetical protein
MSTLSVCWMHPGGGVIFDRHENFQPVAVLRTLPEMKSVLLRRESLGRERTWTIPHVLELRTFAQDRIRVHQTYNYPRRWNLK